MSKIIQIIPAVSPLYVVEAAENKYGEYVYGVEMSNYLALLDNGDTVPLVNFLDGSFDEPLVSYEVYEEYAYNIWKKTADREVEEWFRGIGIEPM